MKRTCVVAPKSAKKSVKAATSSKKSVKASTAWFNAARASLIKNKLTSLMDILESCDAETYEAIDGDAMFNDLQIYARQIDVLLNPGE